MKSAEETAFDWYIKRIAQLEAELTEAELQRDTWKRIAESGLGMETNNVQGTPLGRLAHETGSVPETFAEPSGTEPTETSPLDRTVTMAELQSDGGAGWKAIDRAFYDSTLAETEVGK